MRAPTPSFNDHLETYRALVMPDRAELVDHWKHRLVTEVLDRWSNHPDKERIWRDLSKKLPPDIPAGILIGAVVFARIQADEVAERLPKVPDLIFATKSDLKRPLASGGYAAVSLKARLLDQLIASRAGFSRKAKDAAKKRFMHFLQNWFHDKCGRALRGDVATLTDIAFGGEHHIDSVREAMRRPMRRTAKKFPK